MERLGRNPNAPDEAGGEVRRSDERTTACPLQFGPITDRTGNPLKGENILIYKESLSLWRPEVKLPTLENEKCPRLSILTIDWPPKV